ncbi:phage minor capsid protein [Thermoactinomyces sp. DSM 45892]|uniref:phage minor capsid protein n=1 Tax=Thermoactinomyces sp. DSM 45892 TaxID=1882753 RepID=UPI00089A85B9|nr:phage minor capsid protein [Thermoactinomyces sp. DSM 45892]SDZ00689.1 Phage minor capsid protein 2 [Thermoactinomyces sp. DSM 45892]
MISGYDEQRLYEKVSDLYIDVQIRLLAQMKKSVEQGIKYPNRQAEIANQLDQELRRIMRELGVFTPQAVYEVIERAYEVGIQSVDEELQRARSPNSLQNALNRAEKTSYDYSFNQVHTLAVESLAGELVTVLSGTHGVILNSLGDRYREIVARSSMGAITGVDTRRQGAQRLLNQLSDRGITSFIDRSGRNWDMSSYTEMSTRSAVARAQIKGHVDRLSHNGYDLVKISSHFDPSPLCKPWQGKVFSISGKHPKYLSLQTSINSGLFHPNCRHSLSAYQEGEKIKPVDVQEGAYLERQKQRYIERQIRKWKQREAVALTREEQQKARGKVREWQAEMREFIQSTDRRRDYAREQIGKAK